MENDTPINSLPVVEVMPEEDFMDLKGWVAIGFVFSAILLAGILMGNLLSNRGYDKGYRIGYDEGKDHMTEAFLESRCKAEFEDEPVSHVPVRCIKYFDIPQNYGTSQ